MLQKHTQTNPLKREHLLDNVLYHAYMVNVYVLTQKSVWLQRKSFMRNYAHKHDSLWLNAIDNGKMVMLYWLILRKLLILLITEFY